MLNHTRIILQNTKTKCICIVTKIDDTEAIIISSPHKKINKQKSKQKNKKK